MIRQALHPLLLFAVCAFLSSCWNYRSLDSLDIVTGMSVDQNEKTGKYHLTFEIVNLQSADKGEYITKYVDAEGSTFFEAIRNSKKRLINKLYGGNMQTLVISKQLAESKGIFMLIEELLRDGEPRETLVVVISKEPTAREILLTDGIDSRIIAFEIHDMVKEDNRVTSSTKNLELYSAYNAIKGTGNALVLPVIRCVSNDDKTVAEANGIALFKQDRLVGFQSPEQTMLYLFVMNELRSGVLAFPFRDPEELVSLEILSNTTNTAVSYGSGQASIRVSLNIHLNVLELKSQADLSAPEQRRALEAMTEKVLEERITAYIREVQNNQKFDIFGLGRRIYEKNPKTWLSIKDQWDELFCKAQIEVKAKADIKISGVIKAY